MITLGTSGLVMPAAALAELAKSSGARIATIHPESGGGNLWLQGPAAGVLPALMDEAFGEASGQE